MTAVNPSPLCLHCGSPVPQGRERYCCDGCEAVRALLETEALTRYYTLADGKGAPVPEVAQGRSLAWLEPLVQRAEGASTSVCSLELDVQGIHCAACVWLMNELFRRSPGGADLTVNPALGKVALRWRKGAFDVGAFLRSVERFGYLFGPSRKAPGAASHDLPIRLGVCVALTMNVMIFSIAFYVGLTPAESDVFTLFTRLSLLLSSGVVLVGGWPFFKSAWQALRRRVLHLDLPIALGILLVYGTSLVQARAGRGDLAYLDTLNTFITLMLVGRWLQQRVLERNRRFLLEDDGADGLFARREAAGGALETVRAPQVKAGDVLVVAPGDLVPCDAELLDAPGRFRTDWVTGEAGAREAAQGESLPAGAFNAGERAARVRVGTDFADSPLVRLLRRADPERERMTQHARFWDRVSRRWVVGVLAASALGLLLWLPAGPHRALEVAVALLVVTCPCALGIAVPLAYELAQARLRRQGFFARGSDLLDRLVRVRTLVFDKTGTLTLGRLELADRAVLERLAPEARDAAYELASRSSHPVSRCLAEALGRAGARYTPGADVAEVAGQGMRLARAGREWRLGRPAWTGASGEGTVLSVGGAEVARFTTREAVRPDARGELAQLQARGYGVWLLSGDAPGRVQTMARALGVPEAQALGGLGPEDKAQHVARIDAQDTLYLGDGVNDSLAFERALCAGTPAVDRPVMPGKADFFLLGEGVSGLREALSVAQGLRRTVRRVLAVALAYNALAVTACLLGVMTPLRAAVAMPISSLSLLVYVAWTLGRTRPAPGASAPAATPPVARSLQRVAA